MMNEIFMNLDQENLIKCKNVNQHWEKIMNDRWFLYRTCVYQGLLSPIQQQKWTKVIQTLFHSKLSKHLDIYLAQILSGKWPEKYRSPYFLLPTHILSHPRINEIELIFE